MDNLTAGAYPEEIDDELAYLFGRALSKTFKPKSVLVTSDHREVSDEVSKHLIAGLGLHKDEVYYQWGVPLEQHLWALSTGIASNFHSHPTPDLGVYVTGGDAEDNVTGFRVYGWEGEPLSPTDYDKIAANVPSERYHPKDLPPGLRAIPVALRQQYHKDMANICKSYGNWKNDEFPRADKPLRILVDDTLIGNAGVFIGIMKDLDNQGIVAISQLTRVLGYAKARNNPTSPEAIDQMKLGMSTSVADLGIAWSAEGDRMLFYDDTGRPIQHHKIGVLLQTIISQRYPKHEVLLGHKTILAGISMASSMQAPFRISLSQPTFMRKNMRDFAAAIGVGGDGKYYFADAGWSESGILAAILIAQFACLYPGKLSEGLDDLTKAYPVSGPILYQVTNQDAALDAIAQVLRPVAVCLSLRGDLAATSKTEGVRPEEFKGWRCCAYRHGSDTIGVIFEGTFGNELILDKIEATVDRVLMAYENKGAS